MSTITFEQKKVIVEEWRASGQTQEAFCRSHPTARAPRTLRAWAREVRRPEEGLERALARMGEAVQDVMAIVTGMHATEARSSESAVVTETSEASGGGPRGGAEQSQGVGADDRHQGGADVGGKHKPPQPAEPEPVRPVAFDDPWSRGGGFLGLF
jgi:hypothetical protein